MSATKEKPPVENRTLVRLDWEKPTNIIGLKAFGPKIEPELKKSLPRSLVGDSQRLLRCLFSSVEKVPALMNCAPISLFGGLLQAAQLGLELGGALGQSYLIPYGKNATFVLGYKGAIALAFRSELLKSMPVTRVRDGDLFEIIEGRDRQVIHKPKRGNTGRVTDYYVQSYLTNQGYDFEHFTFEEAMEFRDRYSSTRSAPESVKKWSPWYDERQSIGFNGFDWMACKTLMKRIGKRLPVSVEFQRAIGLDDEADAGVDQGLARLVNTSDKPETVPDDLRNRLEEAKKPVDGVPPDGHEDTYNDDGSLFRGEPDVGAMR